MSWLFDATYAVQRKRYLGYALFCAAVIIVGCIASNRWVQTGNAQQATPVVATTATVDLDDRIEEISRSQDRFVTAILGITGIVGTLALLLVGFNAFQSNRNFERESAAIKEYAEIQIDRAVGRAQADLEEIVAATSAKFEARIGVLFDERSGRFSKAVSELELKNKQLFGEQDRIVGEYIEALSVFIRWSAPKVQPPGVDDPIETDEERERRRRHDMSHVYYHMSFALLRLAMLSREADRSSRISRSLNQLVSAMGIVSEHMSPKEFKAFWDPKRSSTRDLNAVLAKLSKGELGDRAAQMDRLRNPNYHEEVTKQ